LPHTEKEKREKKKAGKINPPGRNLFHCTTNGSAQIAAPLERGLVSLCHVCVCPTSPHRMSSPLFYTGLPVYSCPGYSFRALPFQDAPTGGQTWAGEGSRRQRGRSLQERKAGLRALGTGCWNPDRPHPGSVTLGLNFLLYKIESSSVSTS
jgi:hypothetical protein